jgi:hypothetical protein
MPPDQLKLVATRHFNNASQVETALQVRAPVAASRAKEILETIFKARKDYKNKSASFTASIPTSSAPATSTSSEVITPVMVTNVDDIWADFTSTAPSTEPFPKPAPKTKSSLFGSTFSKKKSTPAPVASRPKGKSSGLFGSTISSKKQKETSPTYDDVTSRIFRDLIPAKRPIIETVESTMPQPLTITASSQSTIPPPLAEQSQSSVSGAAFDQTAPVVEPESDLPEPSPPKRPKTEEVVQVKKSSKSKHTLKPKQDRRRSSSPNWGMKGPKDKDSKTKKRTAEVPTFDYSTAPNLLDNPRSGVKDQGRKKKKERKQPKGTFSGDEASK